MKPTMIVDPRRLAKRMGKTAFLFFLGKGLLWLAAPALLSSLL